MLGYDDSLDAFGVHGVGGIVGAILTGVFASPAIYRRRQGGLHRRQLSARSGSSSIGTWRPSSGRGVVTFIILKVIDVIVGLRVTKEVEVEGLDINLHGEVVQ